MSYFPVTYLPTMSAIPSPAAIWQIATTPVGELLKLSSVPRNSTIV